MSEIKDRIIEALKYNRMTPKELSDKLVFQIIYISIHEWIC